MISMERTLFIAAPLGFVFLTAVGFFITYAWAESNGHVASLPKWPYVSDTGDTVPASCLFTLFLIWAGVFVFISMFLYYKYVECKKVAQKANRIALGVGCVAAVGLTMIASFQFSAIKPVHLVGAGLAFLSAIVYSWIIIYIDLKYQVNGKNGRKLTLFRIMVASIDTICLFFVVIGYILWNKSETLMKNFPTITEWILIYLAIAFLSTLVYEISHLHNLKISLELIEGESEESSAEKMELNTFGTHTDNIIITDN